MIKKYPLVTFLALALITLAGLLSVHADDVISLDSFDMSDEELVDARALLSVSSVAPGKTYEAAVVVDIAPGWHINSAQPYQDFLIPAEVTFDTLDEATPHSVEYPDGHDVLLGEQRMSVHDGELIVPFRVTISQDAQPGEHTIPVRFSYQPCNDRECRAPQTLDIPLKVTVGEEGEAINASIFSNLPTAQKLQIKPASAEPPSQLEQPITDYGFWGYFLVLGLAFVTGLLLSFSPCTYPMIPITVSIFAGQDRTVGRGFFLSLVYVGTMAIVYGLMGLIVSLVGGVFGAWLASPPVVIGIAVVFVIFALSMFGLYELNVPMALRQKLGTTRTGGGVGGALLLGIIAALVVSPCVGPFVAGILLYIATSGSPLVGFLVLFVFALGLGTLFVLIGTFSTAINKLPRSGEWMEQVKRFFGFVLLLMAIYFLRTIIAPAITAVLTALLLLAFGVFGGGLDRLTAESGFFPRLKKFVGVIALLIGGYLLVGSLLTGGLILPPASQWLPAVGGNSVQQQELIEWETDLETGLAVAQAEQKPVLIDTWATWCTNCKVLERKTFQHPDFIAAADRFVTVKVQLEEAGAPETKAFMSRFGLKTYSLPTTIMLDSTGQVQKVLHGVVGPDEMIEHMAQVH